MPGRSASFGYGEADLLVDDLLARAYRPARALPELLLPLLEALAARLSLARATLRLDGPEAIELRVRGARAHEDCVEDGVPLVYAGAPIGELRLAWPRLGGVAPAREAVEAFARRCAYFAKRHDVQRWAVRRLGRPLLLVGVCEPLHRLEVFVEKAAHSPLPVLLTGEFGTEKAHLAATLHCCGLDADRPFVEVNCTDPAGQPAQWFEQARGGTLFFNGIDELAPTLQAQLPQCMHSRLGQWLAVPAGGEIRVIASATAPLVQRVHEGRFSRALLAELEFLVVDVPPLRERQADIASLVAVVLERHGFDARQVLSYELLEICRRHLWPENLFEMERVIARLAVMAGGRAVRAADVRLHAPWMLSAQAVEAHAGPPAALAPAPPPAASPERWAGCAVAGRPGELAGLHDALRKALVYLGEHYTEPLSLPELARHAHVSPSHLGFLFRSALGTTFKPLLQRIRIEKAKQILHADGRQRITEVALSVGFGDLSHFERSFRRVVGQSPREFRRALEASHTPGSSSLSTLY